jgi:hypothetical protein
MQRDVFEVAPRSRRAAVALAIVVTVETMTAAAGSRSAVGDAARCVHIDGNVARYCGPATGRLSVFPGAAFKGGSCTRTRVEDVHLLQVRIGARSLDGSSTNDGLPYLSVGITASRSQPRSESVIAYDRSKRWFGRGISFRGQADRGTIVAQGVAGSRGRAIANFRC